MGEPRRAGIGACGKVAPAILMCFVFVLAANVYAAQPAEIGAVKFLRDGNTEKIVFSYKGSLCYREYQFTGSDYGWSCGPKLIC